MNYKGLAAAIGIIGLAVLGAADAARAEYRYFDCITHTTYGDTTISRPGVCSEWVPDPVATTPRRLAGNAWLDGNSNLRSGASFESGVMFQTTRQERIKLYSWSEDGEWAWIGIWRGEGYVSAWTHKVNVTMDAE